MNDVPISLHLNSDLKDRLEAAARREDRSEAFVAARAIESFLDAQDLLRADMEAAIAEADAGVFVSSEAVERWMASWDTDQELPMPDADVFPDEKGR